MQSGRNQIIAYLLLFFLPSFALAKTTNFATGSPFGFGLGFTDSARIRSDFVDPSPGKLHNAFSVSLDPFIDFTNFMIRFTASYTVLPKGGGSGIDAFGLYNDESKGTTTNFGAHILFVPFISKTYGFRTFVVMGYERASASMTNRRTILSSATVYEEKTSAKADRLNFGAGLEFMLIQNYSLQLETGYQAYAFPKSNYSSGTDIYGRVQNAGFVTFRNGTRKSYDLTGSYSSLRLNINF